MEVEKKYYYSEIFHSIQGEGHYTGVPTAWIRFFLCNLQCSGFGQVDPTNPDTYELPFEDFDVDSVKVVEDLPVWEKGCDSSYTWAKKFKKLMGHETPTVMADKIVDILKNCKCMNPIIYFDELDKVSDTYKGQEIIHMLTHITDASQNSLFVDNYFHGVHIDLSKVLFIFSFNDESKIDRILKDRMYVINTNGYNIKDKIIIANDYLIPKLLNTYNLVNKISLSDDIINHIINNYTHNEDGVRNLNRCIETIISKFNIYTILKDSQDDSINLDYKFTIDNYPYILTIDEVDLLLKKNTNKDKPPEHMYM